MTMDTERIMDALLIKGGLIDTLANFTVLVYAIIVGYYIFTSATNAKILRCLSYRYPWLAWVPYLRYYALAKATESEKDTKIYGRWIVPNEIYELWWIVMLTAGILDSGLTIWIPATLGTILDFIVMGVFLGGIYTNIYKRIYNVPVEKASTVGAWSGILPIIAAVKFLLYPGNKKASANKNKD